MDQAGQQFVRHDACPGLVGVGQHQQETAAAQARHEGVVGNRPMRCPTSSIPGVVAVAHHVGAAHMLAQKLRHLHQQGVAHLAAIHIVDLSKALETEIEASERAARAPRERDQVRQHQQRATLVQQSRDRIVVGEEFGLALRAPLFGQVMDGAHEHLLTADRRRGDAKADRERLAAGTQADGLHGAVTPVRRAGAAVGAGADAVARSRSRSVVSGRRRPRGRSCRA